MTHDVMEGENGKAGRCYGGFLYTFSFSFPPLLNILANELKIWGGGGDGGSPIT